MKSQNPLVAGLRLLVVVLTIAAFTGGAVVQAAALPNQIVVKSQDINSGVIVMASVTAAQDGWVVIYKNPNFATSEIVGYAPVNQGANTNVKVTLNTEKIGELPTLWAVLLVDNGVKGTLEVGLRNLPDDDVPVVQNGQYVMATFGTAGDLPSMSVAAPAVVAPAPVAAPTVSQPAKTTKPAAAQPNQINVKTQDISNGVIVVDSVLAARDGWIVIYKNPNFTNSEIVGYARVYQGTNTNVKVTLNTGKIGDLPMLWARLHVDNDVKGVFEVGLHNLPDNDGPVVQNGQAVVATFGTF